MAAIQSDKDAPAEDRRLLTWLEGQAGDDQKSLTKEKLTEYFDQASQPRHASGNACIKLCYFIELCTRSDTQIVKDVAWSKDNCLRLFNFYIEWNEKNQNRSMRQILELVATLIVKNPSKDVSNAIKDSILQRNTAIIGHRGAQPLVKPAFKSLESLLAKGTISPAELIKSYREEKTKQVAEKRDVETDDSSSWDQLVESSFEWMSFPDISPAAGKFLITLFRELRSMSVSEPGAGSQTLSWQRWIRRGLEKDPESLENVKNYLFPPLFKIDRPGSLQFLEELNSSKATSDVARSTMDSQALLHLAAMDAGKKAGLVEDASAIDFPKLSKKKGSSITLHEESIGHLLVHSLDTVRSLALSVLVHSSSSIRPFTPITLQLLRLNLGAFYSDTDAKFRNDVLSNTKHMVERLRGATAFLSKEAVSGLPQLQKSDSQNDIPNLRDVALQELLAQHEEFLDWFIEFLLGELVPTASYQRHITALKALHLLFKSGILTHDAGSSPLKSSDNDTVWPFSVNFFKSTSTRLLLDLLLDPFEDVRSATTDVLKLAPRRLWFESVLTSNGPQATVNESEGNDTYTHNVNELRNSTVLTTETGVNYSTPILHNLLHNAAQVANRTGRADYADGVAHIHELIFHFLPSDFERMNLLHVIISSLQAQVTLAEVDLGKAVHDAPIHGTLASLGLVWNSMQHGRPDATPEYQNEIEKLQCQIVSTCLRIWKAVKDVLCNDSPEGLLLQDQDEADILDTKDILSYSFRAVHESSNLMQSIADKIKPKYPVGLSSVPPDVFSQIGNLTFEQLSTLRHRGAFSTVSLTFARVCQLTQYLPAKSVSGQSLLEQYYQGALQCIFEQASTTRRSAGIPALIAGVLSANAKTPSFQDVMTKLKTISSQSVKLSETDETNLPQVHAMNCLKDIFRSSVLGKRAESHITDALQIAADSLTSDIWAIRNCGLLLLRSLIDCLFGTSESKHITEAGWDGRSIKLAYDKFPALSALLLKLLHFETSIDREEIRPQIGAVESVFPALDIIRRAGPPELNRNEIFAQACKHLASKVWHVREIAARTVCTLLIHDDWLQAIKTLLSSCGQSTNYTHGVLMAVRFFLERQMTLDLKVLLDSLPALFDLFKSFNSDSQATPTHIRAAQIELQNTIASVILAAPELTRSELAPLTKSIGADDDFSQLKAQIECASQDALLQLAIVRRAIYMTSLRNDSIGLWRVLKIVAQLSTDLTSAALTNISEAWRATTGNLVCLVEAYVQIIEFAASPDVRATAAINLADLLDASFDGTDLTKGVLWEIDHLPRLLQEGSQSPNISNAQLRISGWVLQKEVQFQSPPESSECLEAWGHILAAAGDANNDFDTRLAAVSALRSFFALSKLETTPINHYFLPALFALYDTLNDDDDDIRDLGAETVSFILKESLVPLAAQKRFLEWLSQNFSDISSSSILARTVVYRMIGSSNGLNLDASVSASAEQQLQKSLQQDNALFVEEEQNLFIDEAREASQFRALFSTLSAAQLTTSLTTPANKPISVLSTWTVAGLKALNNVSEPDRPLGWTSKPAAFTACTRILSCAGALLSFRKEVQNYKDSRAENVEEVRDELEKVKAIPGFHPILLALANEALSDSVKVQKKSSWIIESSRGRLRDNKVVST